MAVSRRKRDRFTLLNNITINIRAFSTKEYSSFIPIPDMRLLRRPSSVVLLDGQQTPRNDNCLFISYARPRLWRGSPKPASTIMKPATCRHEFLLYQMTPDSILPDFFRGVLNRRARLPDCRQVYLRENIKKPGSVLLSRAVTSTVPSAFWGLTSLFGMERGVSPRV